MVPLLIEHSAHAVDRNVHLQVKWMLYHKVASADSTVEVVLQKVGKRTESAEGVATVQSNRLRQHVKADAARQFLVDKGFLDFLDVGWL